MAVKKKATGKKPTTTRKALAKKQERFLISGKRRVERLDAVRPNDWNPNKVPPHKFESIKHSMQEDGWLESQPILVWATDERGRKKNIIIDGEHRWRAGIEVGFAKVPMVLLDRVSKRTAQALTIKLDNNRGTFDPVLLADVLKDLVPKLKVEGLAESLGFKVPEVTKVLATQQPRESSGVGGGVVSKDAITKVTPLYMDVETHAKFMEMLKVVGQAESLETATSVVRFAVSQCFKEIHSA